MKSWSLPPLTSASPCTKNATSFYAVHPLNYLISCVVGVLCIVFMLFLLLIWETELFLPCLVRSISGDWMKMWPLPSFLLLHNIENI